MAPLQELATQAGQVCARPDQADSAHVRATRKRGRPSGNREVEDQDAPTPPAKRSRRKPAPKQAVDHEGEDKENEKSPEQVAADEEKRQELLRRNREAAARCREKKKMEQEETIRKTLVLNAQNEVLKEKLQHLKEEFSALNDHGLNISSYDPGTCQCGLLHEMRFRPGRKERNEFLQGNWKVTDKPKMEALRSTVRLPEDIQPWMNFNRPDTFDEDLELQAILREMAAMECDFQIPAAV